MSDDSSSIHLKLKGLLDQTTLGDLFHSIHQGAAPKPVVVDAKSSVVDACRLLAKHGISSAPVWDSFDHCFKGCIDYRDLASLLIRAFHHKGPDGKTWQRRASSFGTLLTTDVEITDILSKGLLAETPIRLVTDYSHQNPLISMHSKVSLWEAVRDQLCLAHRVCLVDSEGNYTGVISQSDVIRFLYDRLKDDAMMKLKLNEFGLIQKKVFTVNADDSVMSALIVMHDNQISSVGVLSVDPTDSGVMLGSLSMTDIKYIVKGSHFSALKATCFEYINSVRQLQSFEDHQGKDVYPVFSVKVDSTLGLTMSKIVATRAHRVYMVEDRKPVGVVTLSDLLQAILKN